MKKIFVFIWWEIKREDWWGRFILFLEVVFLVGLYGWYL